MMIDEDIAYVSPATSYRMLRKAGLLNRWAMSGPSRKGTGFVQPETIHQHWLTDLSCVNILGTFYFLISVLDGNSRYILRRELRSRMQEYDVVSVIRCAKEKYPEASATLISDHGPQYVSNDFKTYIRESGIQHTY
jgi:putative transposase